MPVVRRTSGRAWLTALVALTAIALALSGTIVSPERSDAAGTSHVIGTVTSGLDDGPLGGVYVAAFQKQGGSWSIVTFVKSGADGTYDLGNLAAGTYRIGFNDYELMRGYLPEYWDDQPTIDAAADVVIGAGQTIPGVDARLEWPGQISGTVTGVGGVPLKGVAVTAYRPGAGGSGWVAAASGGTTSDGSYAVNGLRAGTYRLGFSGDPTGHLGQFWDDADSLAEADDIDVGEAAFVTGKNAQLHPGGHITGTITDPDGDPVDDVLVQAYPDDDTSGAVRTTTTDSEGHYDVNGLTTGAYRLRFGDQQQRGLLVEWWQDATSRDDAEPVAVTAGETVADIDPQLDEGGHVAGTVTDGAGDPIENIWVYASSITTPGGDDSYAYVHTDESGAYDLGGLRTGSYRIQFAGGTTYTTEYWQDSLTEGGATPVSVTAGSTTAGIDAALSDGAHLRGTVTGADGQPLDQVQVTAYRSSSGNWFSVKSVTTTADGHYDLGSLIAADYRLRFTDLADRGYLDEYWGHTADVGLAQTITLATDQRVTTDLQLTLGGHVAGTVTGPQGELLPGVRVTVFRSANGNWYDVTSATTDADGHYDIDHLWPRTYRVGYVDPLDRGYTTEYWEDAADVTQADDLTVAAANTTTADAVLARTATVSGTVTDVDDQPVAGIAVAVYAFDSSSLTWNENNRVYTNPDGTYTLPRLPAGTYRLGFLDEPDGGRHYVDEFWQDSLTLDTASNLVLEPGEVRDGTDVELAPAAHLTGTVADEADNVLPYITVTAYSFDADDDAWVEVAHDNADNDGHFDVDGLAAGSYRLGYADDSGYGVLDEFWDDQPDVESADDIVLGTGETVGDLDAELAEGGHVTGTVLTPGGQPAKNVVVSALAHDDDTDEWVLVGARYTDNVTGTYDVGGLPTGVYRLRFFDVGATYATEYWNDKPTVEDADDVLVTAGATTPGKDAQLASQPPVLPLVSLRKPAVAAKPVVGTYAYVTYGNWNPMDVTLDEQWLLDGTPIPGASGTRLLVTPTMVGHRLQVRETATRTGSEATSATSTSSAPVAPGTVRVVSRARTTGKVRRGAVVSVSPGRYSPATVTVRIQWYAGGKAIPGASKTRLRLSGTAARLANGKVVTVRVTVTSPGYRAVATTVRAGTLARS